MFSGMKQRDRGCNTLLTHIEQLKNYLKVNALLLLKYHAEREINEPAQSSKKNTPLSRLLKGWDENNRIMKAFIILLFPLQVQQSLSSIYFLVQLCHK